MTGKPFEDQDVHVRSKYMIHYHCIIQKHYNETNAKNIVYCHFLYIVSQKILFLAT